MTDEYDHRCSHADCPFRGQLTRFNKCKCHVTREKMMQSRIDVLEKALSPFAKAACALASFELEATPISDDYEIAKIQESKSYSSFRIQAAHLRKAKKALIVSK